MAEAAVKEKKPASRARSRARADGRLSSHHRCAQAQRPQDDLRRARHPDHGLRPHGAGRRHSRPLVPARAERRLCRVDRRLPDQKARHLPHGVGARLSQRPDRARQRHDQLFSDDPGLGLLRARGRRPAAGRLRGNGPARHRQAAVQGGLPHAARAGHRHRSGARDPRRRLRASGRRLSRPAGQAVRAGDGCRGRRRSRWSRSSTRRRPKFRRPARSSARSTCSKAPSAR